MRGEILVVDTKVIDCLTAIHQIIPLLRVLFCTCVCFYKNVILKEDIFLKFNEKPYI